MKNAKKGFILIAAYGVVAVLLVLVAAYVGRSIGEMRAAQMEKNTLSALYAAETGVDYGLDWLRLQPSPPAGTSAFAVTGGPALPSGTTYTVTIDPNDSNPTSYLKRYQIIGVGQSGGATRRVNFEVQVDSFARYVWFTYRETFSGNNVWFITNDVLNGPTHTDGTFNIAGNPSFLDDVSQVGPAINYMHGGPPNDNPNFAHGVQFNADPLSMPSRAADLRNAASTGGLHLLGPTTIVLNSNGTINVTNTNAGYSNRNMPLPANGAVFVENRSYTVGRRTYTDYGDVTVNGTMNGRLSIGANNDIIIGGDLRYNINPQTNPDSTDMLGLVAERNIMIPQNACPYNSDLTIQASVMAMADSFYLQNYSDPANYKGTLNVYGGIIQKYRGPVGTFNITTNSKVSGFTKNYVYDGRLRASPPPFFPTTGDYYPLTWREQ